MRNKIIALINSIRLLNFYEWKLLIKQHPKATLAIASTIVGCCFCLFSPSKPYTAVKSVEKIEKPTITSVKDAVDPRAVWVDQLTATLDKLNKKFDDTLQEQQQGFQQTLSGLQAELKELKEKTSIKTNENLKTSSLRVIKPLTPKPSSNFMYLHQTIETTINKDPENYVVSGSFARAVLLTGVVAETGTDAAGSPQPILLRLVDHGIFSKGYKTQQIKEAILIGACHGNISSERALCRLQSLSLMNNDGEIIEKPVEGWVIGEDGRPGIKGDVIDKASDVSRMAMLNGILGGMASFFQSQATAGVYPISPLTGQQHALTGAKSLQASSASGAGNALQKLADYAIKRAEQMSPVIIIGAGRTVDVVFKNGFGLKNIEINTALQPVTSVSQQQRPHGQLMQTTSSDINSRNQGYSEGMKSLDSLQMEQGNF